MNLMHGNMWEVWDKADLFLITANSTIRDGKLVMGAGTAREARDRFPGLDAKLAEMIKPLCGSGGRYYLLISHAWPKARLGCLQTKTDPAQDSTLELVRYSLRALEWWAKYHSDKAIHVNFPGIGYGNLSPHLVMPYLHNLPDNVSVWQKGE